MIELDPETDMSDSETVTEPNQESDTAAPAVYNEIVVQTPPNRTSRRALAKAFGYKASAFLAVIWPRNLAETMLQGVVEKWEQAMERELISIHKNKVWKLLPRPKNAKAVKSRWVLRIKDNGLYKVRFCAKGFTQRWGEDYDETFAPVAKDTSIRTLIALLAGRRKAKIHQMDVNTAFLYSVLNEVVYVE